MVGYLLPFPLSAWWAARCLLSVAGAVSVPVEVLKFLPVLFSFSYKCLASPACWRLDLRTGSELQMDGARCLGALHFKGRSVGLKPQGAGAWKELQAGAVYLQAGLLGAQSLNSSRKSRVVC